MVSWTLLKKLSEIKDVGFYAESTDKKYAITVTRYRTGDKGHRKYVLYFSLLVRKDPTNCADYKKIEMGPLTPGTVLKAAQKQIENI
jgi:hypothetical protein